MAKAKSEKKADDEAPAETAATEPTPKLTQREAVKQAIAAGADSPADGVPYIAEKFGLTLNNQSFSTLKSLLKKEREGGAKTAEKKGPGRPAKAASSNKAEPEGSRVGNRTQGNELGNGSPAALAQAVKQLIAVYGAGEVVAMAQVFEK